MNVAKSVAVVGLFALAISCWSWIPGIDTIPSADAEAEWQLTGLIIFLFGCWAFCATAPRLGSVAPAFRMVRRMEEARETELMAAHGAGQWGALRDAAKWLGESGHAALGAKLLEEFRVPDEDDENPDWKEQT